MSNQMIEHPIPFITEERAVMFLNGEAVKELRGTYEGNGRFRELEYGEVSVLGFSTKPGYITVENIESREGHIPLEDAETVAAMIGSMQEWLRGQIA
jgi:hypothetical protein